MKNVFIVSLVALFLSSISNAEMSRNTGGVDCSGSDVGACVASVSACYDAALLDLANLAKHNTSGLPIVTNFRPFQVFLPNDKSGATFDFELPPGSLGFSVVQVNAKYSPNGSCVGTEHFYL